MPKVSSVLQCFSPDEDYTDTDEDDDEDENMDNDDVEQKKRGPKEKPFNESGKSAKKCKTDDILNRLRQTATKLGMSFIQLVLYLLKREADCNGDRDLRLWFQELNKYGINGQPKMTPLKALATKKKLAASRNKYVEMIKLLPPNVLPSKDKVKQYEDSIKILLEPFMGGYKADFKDAVAKTIIRILDLKKFTGNVEKLIIKLSAGFDGSGSHVQRAGRDSDLNTKVRFLYIKNICIQNHH